MCFVSFVPTDEGFVFSSNRDEAPHRNARSIESFITNETNVYYPADILGGSWFFASQRGDVICLLNGAFISHKRRSQYRMSRGLMLKAYFEYRSPVDFISKFDFSDIEPFTMIIISSTHFFELVWDGSTKYIRQLSKHQVYNWSSSSLYSPRVQYERSKWFMEAIQALKKVNLETINEIHQMRVKDRMEDSLIMNRNDVVKTISITQLELKVGRIKLSHFDLINGEQRKVAL